MMFEEVVFTVTMTYKIWFVAGGWESRLVLGRVSRLGGGSRAGLITGAHDNVLVIDVGAPF